MKGLIISVVRGNLHQAVAPQRCHRVHGIKDLAREQIRVMKWAAASAVCKTSDDKAPLGLELEFQGRVNPSKVQFANSPY